MTRCDWMRAGCLIWLTLGLGLGSVHYWTVLPPIIAYLIFATDGIFRPGSRGLLPVIRHGDRQGNRVALTFDDGPDPELTPRILDILREHGARATFFVIGRHARTHPELIRRIRAEGHELGNHSFHHSRLLNLHMQGGMRTEILRGMEQLTGQSPTDDLPLYRPPMGLKSPALARVQRRLGLKVVTWSLHASDTRGKSADAIEKRVTRRIRPGDIVLFHDGHDLPGRHRPVSVAIALQRILPVLAKRGINTVTVTELLSSNLDHPERDAAVPSVQA